MVDTQVAYTSITGRYRPEYCNLSLHDNGSNILTVRTDGAQTTSVINIPPEELMKFGKAMIARAISLGVKL